MRSIHSNTGLSKKEIIARVIESNPEKVIFTQKQMDQFYDLAMKCSNGSLSKKELITELRGGVIENWVAAFGIIIAIIMLLNTIEGQEQLFHLICNGCTGISSLEITLDIIRMA